MTIATLRIIDVHDRSTDYIEADGVSFSVIKGEITSEEVKLYFDNHDRSLCNIEYSEESKEGYFIDLDFSFKEGQEIVIEKGV